MPKFLRKNHSSASPGSIIFLDVQTEPSGQPQFETRKLHKLFCGTASYVRLEGEQETRRKEFGFTTQDEFWLWMLNVSQPKRPTWVFAHNMGFALTCLEFWETLHRGEWRIRDADFPKIAAGRERHNLKPWSGFYVDADPPTIISCKHISGQRAIFCDVQNYWPIPLAKIAEFAGVVLPVAAKPGDSDQKWENVSRSNLKVIDRVILGLIKWVKDNDYGMFRYTASGIAMAAFRHRFKDPAINLERPDEVMKLERQSYFGGRLEMLYEGKYEGDVWELDMQSMYPSIMGEEFVPRELVSSWLDGTIENYLSAEPGRFLLAEVLIETGGATYPLRLDHLTIYPHGRYWTVLCGRELEFAFKRGHVSCVGRWAAYQLSNMFKGFVDHFWQKRMAAIDRQDTLEAQLCKTIPNSLYGKWGQQTPGWVPCGENHDGPRWGRFPSIDHETQTTYVTRHIGQYVERMDEPREHSMSFCAIAAWVTSAARERMRRLVAMCGREQCLYVVYDAVFVTKLGFQRLWNAGEIKPGQLGKLKIAGYGKDATFRGFNDYTIGDKRVLSGIKPDAGFGPDGKWRQSEVQGIAEITSSQPRPGVLVGVRAIRPPARRRRWQPSSDNWTFPLEVEADQPRHLHAIREGKPLTLEQI